MRLLHALVVVLASAGWACAQDPVTDYAPGNPRMNAAISSAQDSLGLFLAHALQS